MIKVFTVDQAAEAHLIRGLLQAQGIAVEIRGETPSQVWVLRDPQMPQALELLARYGREEAPMGLSGAYWTCPGCGEEHAPEFPGCWQCGSQRSLSV